MTPAVYKVIDPKKNNGFKYELLQEINYYSSRYKEWVCVAVGTKSDGATGAKDLPESISWWVHDQLCVDKKFFSGRKCTVWMASMVLRDILEDEGHTIRKITWKWATFAFGRVMRRIHQVKGFVSHGAKTKAGINPAEEET